MPPQSPELFSLQGVNTKCLLLVLWSALPGRAVFSEAGPCRSNPKASRGVSLQRGVSHSHSQGPAASVVPHAHASTDDKDNLCSSFLPIPLLGLPWVGIGWLAPHLLFVLGDTCFSFMLPADGVSLAAPLSNGLASSCLLPSTVPFLCPLPVQGEGSMGRKGWMRRQWLPSCSWANVKAPTNPLPWFSA